jgi:hypothetical protein
MLKSQSACRVTGDSIHLESTDEPREVTLDQHLENLLDGKTYQTAAVVPARDLLILSE